MLEKRKRAIENEKEREMKRKHLKNNVQSLHSIVSTVKSLLYAKKTRRRRRRKIALILYLRNREQTKQPTPTDDDEKEGRTRRKYNNKKNK